MPVILNFSGKDRKATATCYFCARIMTDTIAYIRDSLKDCYPSEEIRAFTRLIMEDVCGIPPHRLLADKGSILSVGERHRIEEIVGRLRQSEPVQYILGKTCFYGLPFRVNPSVLIPRPETEELVELILTDEKGRGGAVLDIGTGSGCIACTLAKLLHNSRVTAVDVSEAALAVARENARLLGVAVDFVCADIFSEEQTGERIAGGFDVIVSNPPYVTESEKGTMEKNVLDYEPHTALFVPDDDPLVFYRRIARFGRQRLNRGGRLYMEINARLGGETAELLRGEGYGEITVISDISGKERIVKATFENCRFKL
ncbi:Release factor glutamine methyltransferase [Bacteroidales bacterium Barb6]|nr:Release factor glutamine methyltransferase [Bacteroidales bacterium Barb6]